MNDLGMEKRPRRFSLHETFFEGTQFLMIKAKGVGEEYDPKRPQDSD